LIDAALWTRSEPPNTHVIQQKNEVAVTQQTRVQRNDPAQWTLLTNIERVPPSPITQTAHHLLLSAVLAPSPPFSKTSSGTRTHRSCTSPITQALRLHTPSYHKTTAAPSVHASAVGAVLHDSVCFLRISTVTNTHPRTTRDVPQSGPSTLLRHHSFNSSP